MDIIKLEALLNYYIFYRLHSRYMIGSLFILVFSGIIVVRYQDHFTICMYHTSIQQFHIHEKNEVLYELLFFFIREKKEFLRRSFRQTCFITVSTEMSFEQDIYELDYQLKRSIEK